MGSGSFPQSHSRLERKTMAAGGSTVCVFGMELTPLFPLPAHPPMLGHVSCRHTESVICGELRCLIADGGASAQLGMRPTQEKVATRETEYSWQRGRSGENVGMPSHWGYPLPGGWLLWSMESCFVPAAPTPGMVPKKKNCGVAQLCTPMVM